MRFELNDNGTLDPSAYAINESDYHTYFSGQFEPEKMTSLGDEIRRRLNGERASAKERRRPGT